MRAGVYYRCGKRWAKVAYISSGPVDLRPAQYSVAMGRRGEQVAHTVKLCHHWHQAEKAAKNYVDRLLVTR